MAKRVFALGVPLLLIAGLTYLIAVRASAATAVGPLAWSDDFSGAAGASVSSTSWRAETGGSGWGNQELQTYTDSTSNAHQDGSGHLVITARQEQTGASCWYGPCQYTSARLITSGKFSQAYGRFEARIQIPRGQGMWPAFWLLGDDVNTAGWPNSGEIDVMENVGKEPGTAYGSLHSPGHSGPDSLHAAYTLPDGQSLADDFHVYSVDWKPDSITWSVDGKAYSTKTRADVGASPWPFDHPFFVILNVAVGGSWPGSPDATTALPQNMLVDYVRVYEDPSHASPSASSSEFPAVPTPTSDGATGPIGGLGGQCVTLPGSGADGTQLEMWDCNGASNQSWNFAADGTVRALGKCMDVAGGSLEDGAAIQAAVCNGGSAQQFRITSGSDLVNTSANKCVDVGNANLTTNSANGARLRQSACAGSASQKFWRQ